MSNRRTLYGTVAQLQAVLRRPISADFLKATSLNRKLNIQPNAVPNPGELCTVRGYVCGIGGQTSTQGTHGLPLVATNPHTAVHAAPYYLVPIVLREPTNDLSAIERQRYGLRCILPVGGVNMIAYYLRRMDTSQGEINSEDLVVANNQTTVSDFVPDDINLSPQPLLTSVEVPNPLEGKFVRASAPVEVALDAFDVTEMIAACTLLFGPDTAYGNITELCIMTGVDRMVTGDNGLGGTVSYNEVIGAQVMQHIPSRIMLSDFPEGFSTTYDFGGSEPLYVPR